MGSISGSTSGIANFVDLDILEKLKDVISDIDVKSDISNIQKAIKLEDKQLDLLINGEDFKNSPTLNFLKTLDIYKKFGFENLTYLVGRIVNPIKYKVKHKDPEEKLKELYKNVQTFDSHLSTINQVFIEPFVYQMESDISGLEELCFDNYDENDDLFQLLRKTNNLIKEKENKNEELEAAIKQKEIIYREFMHTLGNVIAPNLLYKAAKNIQNKTIDENQMYTALINAYLAEEFLLDYKSLAELKLGDPKTFQKSIEDELTLKGGSRISIEKILMFSIARIIAYALFENSGKYEDLLNQLPYSNHFELVELRKSFITDVFYEDSKSVLIWLAKYFPPIKINISPSLEFFTILERGFLSTLLTVHLQELFLNAFKHRDLNSTSLVDIDFDEECISNNDYLSVTFSNQKLEKIHEHQSGVNFINEDLIKLNGNKLDKYLWVDNSTSQFTIKLLYDKKFFTKEIR